MGFLVSQAYDYNQFVRAVRSYTNGFPQLKKTNAMLPFDGIVVTGTGAGELYTASNTGCVAGVSPGTAYRLTCTLGGGAGVAKFTMKRDPAGANVTIGAVSGVTADVRFRDATYGEVIVRTTTNWVIGDQINWSMIDTLLGSQKWVEDRFTEDVSPDGNGNFTTEWISHGPGLGGGLSIHGIMNTTFDNANDRFFVALRSCDSYASGSVTLAQPNISPVVFIHLRKSSPMPFWLCVNGDRLVGACKAAGVYEWFHIGYLSIFGTPGNHPRPVFVGGTSTRGNIGTSDTDTGHRAFFSPGLHSAGATGEGACFRWVDGTWYRGFYNYDASGAQGGSGKTGAIIPYGSTGSDSGAASIGDWNGFMQKVVAALGTGNYQLLPVTLVFKTTPQNAIVGDFQGIKAISGNSQASENLVTIGGDTYIVLQDTFRTSRAAYAALKLE